MSHSIPVFFLPLSDDEIPTSLDKWYDAEDLLAEKWDTREQNGLRMSTSRNWWHQYAIVLICEHLQISGLEFLTKEIVCLASNQIEKAISAIDKFFDVCEHGIPPLPPEAEETGVIQDFRSLSSSEFEKAYFESRVDTKINSADMGYDSLVDFFSFLKTLRATLRECLSQNKKFLYVQPQP